EAVERRQEVGLGGDVYAVFERDSFIRAGRHQLGDVAVEAALARLDPLEQRRLAGEAEGAARLTVLLKYRDAVSSGDQRRIGQARGPGADHGDALALRRGRRGEPGLAGGGAVVGGARRPARP